MKAHKDWSSVLNLRRVEYVILFCALYATGCGGGSGAQPAPPPVAQDISVTVLNPSSVMVGDQVTVLISGTNFASGATCDFGTGVSVNLCEFSSSSQLSAHLSVAPTAVPGARTVTVTNPGGKTGTNSTGFSIKSQVPSGVANLILNITDGPLNGLLSFSIDIEKLTLKPFGLLGGGQDLVLGMQPRRVEISRLAGSAEPVVAFMVHQASTGCSMEVKFASPEVSYVNTSGAVIHRSAQLINDTAGISFSCSLDPPINLAGVDLTGAPLVITLDFQIASSLAIDGTGSVSVTPVLSRRLLKVGSENPQHVWSGALENFQGVVIGTDGSKFSLAGPDQQAFSFLTDSGTSFLALNDASDLKKGMILRIEALTGTDGQFTAKEVKLEEGSLQGQESQGIVTSVTGAPASQVSIVEQLSLTAGASLPESGSSLNVTLSGASYEIDSNHVDLSNLSFTPTFNNNSIFRGQVIVVDTNQPSLTLLPARKVRLGEQALQGIPSNVNSSGGQTAFTLQPDAGSAFARLTGATSLRVIQQPNTVVTISGAVIDFPALVVRGLLFKTPTGYVLVANSIGAP